MYVVIAAVVRLSHRKNKTGLQSDCTQLHQEIGNIVKSQCQLLRTFVSQWNKENLDVVEVKIEESERPAVGGNRTQDTWLVPASAECFSQCF